MLKPNRRLYQDFTGCGNTVNANHSVVRRLIRECLRYWVQEMHVGRLSLRPGRPFRATSTGPDQ
jgi:hypothetical protein